MILALAALPASVQGTQSVTLGWKPSPGTNVVGYFLYYGFQSDNFTNKTNVGSITNATVSGLLEGMTYFFTVTAHDTADRESGPSNEIAYTVLLSSGLPTTNSTSAADGAGGNPASAATVVTVNDPLPAPWRTVDIGNVEAAGAADISNHVYTLMGAGTLSGTADNFRFVYQPLSRDGEIRVRLDSVAETGTNARVGVMIRESLTSGAEYAFMGVSPDGTFRWQGRDKTRGAASFRVPGETPPNLWMRLVRTGNTFHGYRSIDGTNWTLLGSRDIRMAVNVYIGLAIASGSSSVLNTSVFSDVTVVP
jgi:hypothetical protein